MYAPCLDTVARLFIQALLYTEPANEVQAAQCSVQRRWILEVMRGRRITLAPLTSALDPAQMRRTAGVLLLSTLADKAILLRAPDQRRSGECCTRHERKQQVQAWTPAHERDRLRTRHTSVSPVSCTTNAPRGSSDAPRVSATALGTRYRSAPALCAASLNSRHGAGGVLRRFCQFMSCRAMQGSGCQALAGHGHVFAVLGRKRPAARSGQCTSPQGHRTTPQCRHL